MNNKLKRSIKKLTDKDVYMNENVRNTYINHIVSKLKRGIYPTTSLSRVKSLITKHNKIVKIRKNLKNRG
jgi:hypothetical protein